MDIISTTKTIVLLFFKPIIYIVSTVYRLYTGGPFAGIWCACWEMPKDEEDTEMYKDLSLYQIGSMIIKKSFRKNSFKGYFYAGSDKWPFTAEYLPKVDQLHGYYINKSGEKSGSFIFKNIIGQNNKKYKMTGFWNGSFTPSEKGIEKKLVEINNIEIAAARNNNEKKYCNTRCLKKHFKYKIDGNCIFESTKKEKNCDGYLIDKG